MDAQKVDSAIAFTSLPHLAIVIEEFRPQWLVSIVDPSTIFEVPACKAERLIAAHHDITVPIDGYVHPTEAHVRKLIEFGTRRRKHVRLMVHCQMGRSRSAAAALIFLAQFNPGCEIEVAKMLRSVAVHCTPNRLLIEIATVCSGAMSA